MFFTSLVFLIFAVDKFGLNVTLFMQKVNFPVLEGKSFQASIGSPSVKNINVVGKVLLFVYHIPLEKSSCQIMYFILTGESDELPKVFPNRFESRWFGGWTYLKVSKFKYILSLVPSSTLSLWNILLLKQNLCHVNPKLQ